MAQSALLIASHNTGKVRELASLLASKRIQLLFPENVHFPEPEENGQSYEENAIIKAVSASRFTMKAAIADDCGMEISGLGNMPGHHSKRYAFEFGSWHLAMKEFYRLLGGRESVSTFHCGLALAWPTGRFVSVTATVTGVFVAPRGELGFGYDPCFLPTGSTMIFS